MSKPLRIPFLFGGSGTVSAAADATSDILEVCFDYGWSLAPEVDSLDGSPLWVMEVSNDQSQWYPYDAQMVDASILQPFDDVHFAWSYARIVYQAIDNTTGTISFPLILKG